MKKYTEREVRDLLTPRETPPPPADLAARLRSEIPEHLEVGPASDAGRFRRPSRLRSMLLAASLLTVAGASFLAYRVNEEMTPGPAAREQTVRESLPMRDSLPVRDSLPRGEVSRTPAARAEGSFQDEDAVPGAGAAPPAEAGSGQEHLERRLDRSAAEKRQVEPAPRREGKAVALAEAEAGSRPSSAAPLEKWLSEEQAFAGSEPAPLAQEQIRVTSESPLADRVATGPAAARTGRGERARRLQPPVAVEATAGARSAELAKKLEPLGSAVRVQPVAPPELLPPGDAPYDDVFFRSYGTNPFIDTEDDRLSTFGLDVDTASYTVVRRFLRDGHLPPPDAVRPEELVNYFDYGDEPPRRDDFAIYAEGAPSPFAEGERYHLLRFHLRGRDLSERDRRPADLTFVVDVSGSMARQNRLGLVQAALGLLIGELREGDRVALVVYGSRGRVVMRHTSDHAAIRRAIVALEPEGSTNAEEGLALGYDLALDARRDGTVSRVILCSDGVANTGATSPRELLERIRAHRARGVELTTVGFGMGNYNDVLMEQLADHGNGRYAYVDTLVEARRIFVENLTGTLQTIAAEARVQVDFNPEVVARYRLVGYENRDIADQRFRDDTVDAGEIGAGHAVTALYEIKLHRYLGRRDEVATLHLRYGSVLSGEMRETTRRVTGADFGRRWSGSSPALRLTTLVAEFGEILRQSYWARSGDLGEVFRRAQALMGEFPGDAEVAEFVSLVGRAARYRR